MAKGKKKFEIKTPRGTIYTQAAKGGKVTARLEWNPGFEPSMEKVFENVRKKLILEFFQHNLITLDKIQYIRNT